MSLVQFLMSMFVGMQCLSCKRGVFDIHDLARRHLRGHKSHVCCVQITLNNYENFLVGSPQFKWLQNNLKT